MRIAIAATALVMALVASAAAQAPDARWSAWLGCWQLVDGKADVCIAPASGGVTLTTRVENEPALEQTIVADGGARAVDEGGCRGTQRAEWSRDGRMLFAGAELTCAEQGARRVSGLAFITLDGTWLDLQGVEGDDGRTTVRVRRYRRGGSAEAAPAVAAPGRATGGSSLSVADIIEAHARVSSPVLEAAVAESGARWPGLRAADLIALDEAGVPDAVVDLMVAQTFPSKFQVERRADSMLDLYPSGFMYPYFSHPGYYGSYRYFYAPFGYGYMGYYPGYYGAYSSYPYYPGSIVVIGGGVDTPGGNGEVGGGRAVNGVGYTRVRPREAASAGNTATAAPNGASRGRATASPAGFTQSDSGGNAASSSSGGSTGGDGGRTAVPR